MFLYLLIPLITLLSSQPSYSYPNFIGKGYHNCITCHYNPFGNGPLNDYGRGVAATGLAGRLMFPKSISDETLSKRSGFLFYTPKSRLIRPSLDYRGARLMTNLENDKSKVTRDFSMQVDANLTSEFGKNNKYIASYTYSILPNGGSIGVGAGFSNAKAGQDLTYSREHYLGMKVNKSLSVYLGKMDKVFGIRVPDHTAYSRLITGITQYDATHGVVAHYTQEKFDLGGQFFVGDLEKIKEKRSTGLTSKFEYSVSDKTRMGVSVLTEAFETEKKLMYSFLTKMGVGKNSSLMLEVGQVVTTPDGLDSTTKQYIFLQNHFYLTRGLFFLTTYEQFISDTSGSSEDHRISPGILYFPMQRVELRADLTNSKKYTQNSAVQDTWQFLGQIHLWF